MVGKGEWGEGTKIKFWTKALLVMEHHRNNQTSLIKNVLNTNEHVCRLLE